MGGSPDGDLDLVVAGPWRVRIHEAGVGCGEDVVVRSNGTPDFGLGEVPFEIVFVVEVREAAPTDGPVTREDDGRAGLRLVFTGPERLARTGGIGRRGELAVLWGVGGAAGNGCPWGHRRLS